MPHATHHRGAGDGWVECGFVPDGVAADSPDAAPHRHWGLYGAAGLLLARRTADGQLSDVVLQHRALWSHHGGTWGIPGGAILQTETPVQGALRESREEAGIEPHQVRVRGEHVLDHRVWRYTTVVADLADGVDLEPVVSDPESIEVRWVPVARLHQRPLLPAFGAVLPRLLDLLRSPL